MTKKNDIRITVADWNNRFPLDRWWRKKYNVSFFSPQHRKSTFFGQYYEYHEDRMFEDIIEKNLKEEENKKLGINKEYIPLSGNWWKGKGISKKEIEDWFKIPI